ncbi:hypothetical protein [Sphaerochaeta pleomorpha]|nr:hypothetical protein [Sphaerochaeta pleomorpha]
MEQNRLNACNKAKRIRAKDPLKVVGRRHGSGQSLDARNSIGSGGL